MSQPLPQKQLLVRATVTSHWVCWMGCPGHRSPISETHRAQHVVSMLQTLIVPACLRCIVHDHKCPAQPGCWSEGGGHTQNIAGWGRKQQSAFAKHFTESDATKSQKLYSVCVCVLLYMERSRLRIRKDDNSVKSTLAWFMARGGTVFRANPGARSLVDLFPCASFLTSFSF